MSIGKRLFNLARSELNSLLDRAAEAEPKHAQGRDPDEDLYRRFSLDELSDKELEVDIQHDKKRVSVEAAYGQDFVLLGLDKKWHMHMSPKVETDAARVDW